MGLDIGNPIRFDHLHKRRQRRIIHLGKHPLGPLGTLSRMRMDRQSHDAMRCPQSSRCHRLQQIPRTQDRAREPCPNTSRLLVPPLAIPHPHIDVIDISTSPRGILKMRRRSKDLAQGLLDRIRHISTPLGSTYGIQMDRETAQQTSKLPWFVEKGDKGQGVIGRACLSDNVRIELARIPTHRPVLHEEATIERQLALLTDRIPSRPIPKIRNRIKNTLGDPLGQSDHVLLGLVGLIAKASR